MTAVATPRSPAPSPGASYTPAAPPRYLNIRADLLPQELILTRRVGVVKRRALAALVVVVLAMAGWYTLARWATSGAQADLATAQRQNTQLLTQQRAYQPLVQAQTQSAAIDNTLRQLMVGDLSWTDMLTTLRAKAPAGTQISSVTGTITAGVGAAGAAGSAAGGPGGVGLGILNASGKPQVGTLTIGGTTSDKNAVAAYVDSLGKVTGLAAPFPASVAPAGTRVNFSVQVIVTSDALGGRYAKTSSSTGSSSTGSSSTGSSSTGSSSTGGN